jgi:transposase InsO family protein
VIEAESMDAKVVIAMSPTASAQKSARGSCSTAMSRNLLLCLRGRSWQPLQIVVSTTPTEKPAATALNRASTGSYTPMDKPIAGVRARPPQEPRLVPRLRAAGPNQVWSWDITYLPTTVRRIWLYLYLVIDVWSRKVVAWDVAERKDPAIAADLVSRACLRERLNKGRRQPLILHAENGNAMRAATLESRLEELGVPRSFSRSRISNDNPYSESRFRTVKYRPDYPSKHFNKKTMLANRHHH